MSSFNILIAALFLATGTAGAAELVLTPEEAAAHAIRYNGELAAARMRIEEAQARVNQAGRLPDLEVTGDFLPNVRGREYSYGAGFNQRFPLTSRLKLEKELSREELDLARMEVREAEWKVALGARISAIHLEALTAKLLVNEQQLKTSRELAESSAMAARAGEGSSLDSIQLELEAAERAADRVRLETRRAALEGELRITLNLAPEERLRIENGLREKSDETERDIVMNWEARPDYRSALLRVAAAETAVRLARANRWEDAMVGVFAEIEREEDAPFGIETERSAGIRVAIPLPLWRNTRARIAEMEATAERARKEVEALRMRIANELQTTQTGLTSAARLARTISEELLPKAREVESGLQVLKDQGRLSINDLLRARENRLRLELAAVEARRDLAVARSQFLAAAGQILNP